MNFEISEFEFQKFIDDQTALMLIRVCTSGDNLHGYPFTKETLMEAAERSLRGRPIVAKYDNWEKDFKGHDKLEVPIGYFVEHQTFEYREVENGNVALFAYAVLWKSYAEKEYNVFVAQKDKGIAPIKGVSMEIKTDKWGEKGSWEQDETKLEIQKFTFKGVTILGDSHNPASPGSQAEILSFSKMKKKIEKYFTVNSDEIDARKENHSYIAKIGKEFGLSTDNFVEKEGEKMSLPEDVKAEEVVPEDTKPAEVENCDKGMESPAEDENQNPEAKVEEDDKEDKENPDVPADDSGEEDYKAKYETLMAENEELKTSNGTYMSENEELKKYKFEREEGDKNFAIEETLSKVMSILPKDVVEEYRIKAKEVKFSDVVLFCNEIKARVIDFADFNKVENINRMSILPGGNPTPIKNSNTSWKW